MRCGGARLRPDGGRSRYPRPDPHGERADVPRLVPHGHHAARARASRPRSSSASNAADPRLVQGLAVDRPSSPAGSSSASAASATGPARTGSRRRPSSRRRCRSSCRRRRDRDGGARGRLRPAARSHVARSAGPSTPVSLPPMPTFRAPRGTRDLLPEERAVFDRLDADRDGPHQPLRLPADRDAAVRADGGVRARDRRGHGRRREGAVPDRAPDRGGRVVGAPPGADGRDRAGVRPARDADAARSR